MYKIDWILLYMKVTGLKTSGIFGYQSWEKPIRCYYITLPSMLTILASKTATYQEHDRNINLFLLTKGKLKWKLTVMWSHIKYCFTNVYCRNIDHIISTIHSVYIAYTYDGDWYVGVITECSNENKDENVNFIRFPYLVANRVYEGSLLGAIHQCTVIVYHKCSWCP